LLPVPVPVDGEGALAIVYRYNVLLKLFFDNVMININSFLDITYHIIECKLRISLAFRFYILFSIKDSNYG
jgi:hypothetical protein